VDVSIVSITRFHPHYVERVSKALDVCQTAVPDLRVEHIMVNNGATLKNGRTEPGTLAAKAGGWRVLVPGYNSSYSEANNLGASAGSGEYLLLLNDDAIPEPGFLAKLWEHRLDADLIGGLQLYGPNTHPEHGEKWKDLCNHAGGHLVPYPDHSGRWEPRGAFEGRGVLATSWVTGAVFFLRRDLYLGLGGLDESYFYSCEDSDFCCRLLEKGGSIGVNTSAVSEHSELGTRTGAEDNGNQRIFFGRWKAKLPDLAERAKANWAAGGLTGRSGARSR